jgi:hypothetical protein
MHNGHDSRASTLAGIHAFDRALRAYRTQFGQQNTARYLHASTIALDWFRERGHGKVVFPAIEHRLGDHIALETILKVPQSMELDAALAWVLLPGHGTVTVDIRDQYVHGKITIYTIVEIPKR